MDTAANTKRIALGGVLAALSAAILWLGSLLPGYVIPTAAVAGLVPAAAVLRMGIGGGLAVYGVSGLLALLLLPQKGVAVWYLVIFGYYGVVKSLAERQKRRAVEWAVKLLNYTAAFALLYFLLRDAFSALTDLLPLNTAAVYAIGLVVFVLYDLGFSRLIGLYLRRTGGTHGRGE